MIIQTTCQPFQVTNITNVTATSFSGLNKPADTTTPPLQQVTSSTSGATAGEGIIYFASGGAAESNALILAPFGVGSNGNTFALNVYGWERVISPNNELLLWHPVLLVSLTACTLDSSLPGVANTVIAATNYYCNSMTISVGNSGISVEVVAPGAGFPAHAFLDVKGFSYVGLYFSTGSSATNCNCLAKKQ